MIRFEFPSIFNSISSQNIRFTSLGNLFSFFFSLVHSFIHKFIYSERKTFSEKGSMLKCITAFSLKIINNIHHFQPNQRRHMTMIFICVLQMLDGIFLILSGIISWYTHTSRKKKLLKHFYIQCYHDAVVDWNDVALFQKKKPTFKNWWNVNWCRKW